MAEVPETTEAPQKTMTWAERMAAKAKSAGASAMAKATEMNNSKQGEGTYTDMLKEKFGKYSKEAQTYMTSENCKKGFAVVAAGAATVAATLYSDDLLKFVQNPDLAALEANPALLLELGAMLSDIRHPSAGIYRATLNSAVQMAAGGTDGMMAAASTGAATAAVTGGLLSSAASATMASKGVNVDPSAIQQGLDMIPADVMQEAIKQIKPDDMFALLKLVASAK